MAVFEDREHFIPLRKADLIELLCRDSKLLPQDKDPFRQFCYQISNYFHYEYQAQLEALKSAYTPFDPDTVTAPLDPIKETERASRLDRLFDGFIELMEKGNYTQLSDDDVKAAMEGGASDMGINMNVDFKVFERMALFARGDEKEKRTRRSFPKFWQKETYDMEIYRRLVFIVKLRPSWRLKKNLDVSKVYIKSFKNVPKLDLETMLPGAKLEWPAWDLWSFRLSLLGALGGGLYGVYAKLVQDAGDNSKLVDKLAHFSWDDLKSPYVLTPLIFLGSFAIRQYSQFKVKVQNFLFRLSESLYYQNLENNGGVITKMVDDAEEQECRETLLAYYFLWRHAPPQGWTQEMLDDYIENYLEMATNLKVDFEVDDAVAKLERLHLLKKTGENLQVVSLSQAQQTVAGIWDRSFRNTKA